MNWTHDTVARWPVLPSTLILRNYFYAHTRIAGATQPSPDRAALIARLAHVHSRSPPTSGPPATQARNHRTPTGEVSLCGQPSVPHSGNPKKQ